MNLETLRKDLREDFKDYLAKHDEGYSIDFVPDVIVSKVALTVLQMVEDEITPLLSDTWECDHETEIRAKLASLKQTV